MGSSRRRGRVVFATILAACSAPSAAAAASHPPGVTYPLTPAAAQPSGLAQPLPSTKRYVLVWKDQLIPDTSSPAVKQWVVTHYVGTQKLFTRQIDDYRTLNPNFLMLTYHLAFGLNGADQANPVGNITGPNTYGQEDTDTFTKWVAASGATRENAYQHTVVAGGTSAQRVSYPDPYWLMDIASTEWNTYLTQTLLAWMAFPTAKATGMFFDVGFPPWYNYAPATWWTTPAGGATRQALLAWWNPRAKTYFDGLRAAFAPTAQHPRYLVVPNPDALVDGIDEPEYLAGTDGVFTENWQAVTANPGDWNLSVRRICHFVTAHQKVWMADVTTAGTALTQADREMLIGTYLLARNATSYVMFGNGDLTWYPEYEIDLGWALAEPPDDLEGLRVAGTGGASGGLYARPYSAGVVLVNAAAGALSYTVTSPMKQAEWSGGGAIDANANMAAMTLTYTKDVPAGALSVPARSVVVLRSPAGAPPPGVEGDTPDGGAGGDGGAPDSGVSTTPVDGGGGGSSGGNGDGGGAGAQPGGGSGSSGGCGCRAAPTAGDGAATIALGLLAFARRARRRRG